uniref:c-type cytochrome n=1 Tax=Nocardia abscessus TaxID=120957 RepID=UPI00245864B9
APSPKNTRAGGGRAPRLIPPPPRAPASEQQIYAAMLTGPQNMPKFSDRQLSPEEKRDIVAYVKNSAEEHSPGGWDLGGFGPATEALAIWVVGITLVVGAAMWIGSRS